MAAGMAAALAYMHSREQCIGMSNRPTFCVSMGSGNWAISDSFARLRLDGQGIRTQGTLGYMAPEMLDDHVGPATTSTQWV